MTVSRGGAVSTPITVRAALTLTGALCAAAGAIDAIAYLLFGRIFIANMTGNTVLFAMSAVQRNWSEAALRIGVVLSFLFGVVIARSGIRNLASGLQRRTRLIALAFEFLVLVTLVVESPPYTLRVALLVLLAAAMGVQNDTFRTIGGIQLNTTFITGDLENLGASLANSEDPDKRRQARRRVVVFFTALATYGIGALLGALGAMLVAAKALWIPAAFILAAAAIVWANPEPRPPKNND